jgi:hypothetical protein
VHQIFTRPLALLKESCSKIRHEQFNTPSNMLQKSHKNSVLDRFLHITCSRMIILSDHTNYPTSSLFLYKPEQHNSRVHRVLCMIMHSHKRGLFSFNLQSNVITSFGSEIHTTAYVYQQYDNYCAEAFVDRENDITPSRNTASDRVLRY